MNIGAIIAATVLVAAVGLFIGVFLGVAGKKFAVEVDEKEVAVREALPGNNCGGCGYPGCDGLAAAIAKGEAPVNGCPVGGEPVGKVIAAIMAVAVLVGLEPNIEVLRHLCRRTSVRQRFRRNDQRLYRQSVRQHRQSTHGNPR